MHARDWLLVTILVLGCTATCLAPSTPQDPTYHDFADQRITLSIPHFMDVFSNAGFMLAGLYGLIFLYRNRVNSEPYQKWCSFYCLSLMAVAAGSTYYHLAPDNERLLWDRLPMTIAFSLFFCLILASHVSQALAKTCLPFLLVAGVSATLYWYLSEMNGKGDIRFYAMFQFLPLVIALLILMLYSSNYLNKKMLALTPALYVLAKVCEQFDAFIFEATQTISGHTLKHLFSAIGAYCVLLAIPGHSKHPRRFSAS